MNITPKLYDLFRKLPADVAEAYTSVDYAKTITEIAQKYHLHVDQEGVLDGETYRLMLGLTHPNEFVEKIKNAVNVPPETAKQIAEDINARIFRPIRLSLMKIHKMADENESEENEDGDVEADEAETDDLDTDIAIDTAQAEPFEPQISAAEKKLAAPFMIPKKTAYGEKDPYHEAMT